MQKIKRKKIIRILEAINAGLSEQNLLEQASNFNFQNNIVWTFNDEISICSPCCLEIEGSIPGKEFLQFLNKLSKNQLILKEKKNKIYIRCGKTQATLVKEKLKHNLISIPENRKFSLLPNLFITAIDFCFFSAAKVADRPILQYLFIDKNKVISCDGYRATKYNLESEIKFPFLLLSSIVPALVKFKPVSYYVDNEWIFFQNKNMAIFSCRTIKNEYPLEINNLFSLDGIKIDLPKNLQLVIDRVRTFIVSDFEQDKEIDLIFTKNQLICKGKSNLGQVKEKIEIDYTGEDKQICIHPRFLFEILAHLNNTIIGDKSLFFQGDKFEHVISLNEKDSK